MTTRMPAIFFGHGNPMNALADNGYTQAWREIGRSITKPESRSVHLGTLVCSCRRRDGDETASDHS